MKLFFFYCFLLPVFLFGQGSFAPLGALWKYDYICPPSEALRGRVIPMESSSNTIIAGQPCRKLIVTEIDVTDRIYVYSRNDSVWYYDQDLFIWTLLYDFNAKKGDTWQINYILRSDSVDSMLVTVDSVSTVTFCDQPLKALHISFDTTRFKWGNMIVERIGNVESFLPLPNDDPNCRPRPLRCYKDNVVQCRAILYSCDSIWADTKTHELPKWELYPNPANDHLNISLPEDITEKTNLRLINIFGQAILSMPVSPGSIEVPLPDVLMGMYVAVLSEDSGRILGRKILALR